MWSLTRSKDRSRRRADGATAAAPAVGTGVALELSAGEAFSSPELSTLFVLSVAEVHGVRLGEIERRRTLVMGILLGQLTGPHWVASSSARCPWRR